MAKIRIREIAKDVGIHWKEVVEILNNAGYTNISHFNNTIEKDLIDEIFYKKSMDKNKEQDKKEDIVTPEKKKQKEFKEEKKDESKIEKKKKETVDTLGDTKPKQKILLPEVLTIDEFSKKLNINRNDLVLKLMDAGITDINQPIEYDIAAIISEEFGYDVEMEPSERDEKEEEFPEEDMELRSPIVTIMGHVDHGKTTLLDNIRKTNIAAREAGGITQHIGAYKVKLKSGKQITFLDTPGHEAFTAMRAHGANVTDIAILVVAADDGVKPQTIEAIDHAKAAGIPIIVAVNKIDKPEANPDRIRQELTNYGLVPEDWGGDTIFVDISAKKGLNIDELLDMIVLQAEMMELKANYNVDARGVVIESRLDRGLGPVATVLIQHGKLRVGNIVIIGKYYGKIRIMKDENGRNQKEALPSEPIEIAGINGVPQAGERMKVVGSEKIAREIIREIEEEKKSCDIKRVTSLDELFARIKSNETKNLNLIIKSDVYGSSVAISDALNRLSNNEVKVNIVHKGVGAITETDVMLATASQAIIIGFNVRPMSSAKKLAEKNKIEIRTYRIIYEIIEDVKKAISGLMEPDYKEKVIGQLEVRAIFKISKIGTIAGCYVTDGIIKRNANVRLIRDGKQIYEGKLSSLKRFKDDVKEVSQGYECGVGIENYNDIKVGDVIEAYIIEEIERNIDDSIEDNLE